MRLILVLLVLVGAGLAVYALVDAQAIAQWARDNQRAVQGQMAGAIRAIRAGDLGAVLALFAAAGAYGFFHAVGPGHGKALIGGVGLSTSVSARRLLSLSVVSSLAQSIWAIIIVYGGFWLLDVSARSMTNLAETILAPASYLAIAAVGGFLIWRGARLLRGQLKVAPKEASAPVSLEALGANSEAFMPQFGLRLAQEFTQNSGGQGSDTSGSFRMFANPDEACDCGHAHGPTLAQVSNLTSWRDTVALVGSIAIRPCTGAIFLLVIAWQMQLFWIGAAAAMIMGLGTALFTSVVALSSVAARTMTFLSAGRFGTLQLLVPVVQMLVGGLVLWLSLTLFVQAGGF